MRHSTNDGNSNHSSPSVDPLAACTNNANNNINCLTAVTTAASIYQPPASACSNVHRERNSGSSEHEMVWGDSMMTEALIDGDFYNLLHPTAVASEELPAPLLTTASRTDSVTSTTLCVNPHEIQPQLTTVSASSHQPQLYSTTVAYQQLSTAEDEEEEEQLQSAAELQQQQLARNPGELQHHHHRRNTSVSLSEEILPDYSSSCYLTTTNSNNSGRAEEKQQQHPSAYLIPNGQVVAYQLVENGNDEASPPPHSYLKEEEDSNMSGDCNPGSSSSSGQQQPSSWSADPYPAPAIAESQPTSTGVEVATGNFPGQYEFEVEFVSYAAGNIAKNKHWAFSSRLNKLFVDINREVQVHFRVGPNPPVDLRVRALPVYAEAGHFSEPVRRCPLHARRDDSMNAGFPYVRHLIRFMSKLTEYEEDRISGRLSAVLPVQTPHEGTDYCVHVIKFMCLGSDAGGINRRPVRVVFTLEQGTKVVGRKVVELRICSCPKRDMQQEEARCAQLEENARKMAQKFATTTSVPTLATSTLLMPPPGKKRKMEVNNDTVLMVPVHHEDFKKLNEFAEAAWVCRDPANADSIRDTRRRLLRQHNSELVRIIEKKPKKP